MSRAKKVRITVTLSHELSRQISDAVKAGDADSVSAWFSAAAADWLVKRRRKEAWKEALAMYEAERGPITQEQMDAAEREARRRAAAFRSKRRKKRAA